MSFLAPLGLIALISLPIILLLHLMRERRRRVVVPSLLIWQLLPQRQDTQRRRRLPITLLLLLQLLAAALLALALAQPAWIAQLFAGEQHLAVVVDTSTSMAATVGAQSRLDAARDRVRSLAAGLGPGDTLTLILAGPQPSLVGSADAEQAPGLLAALDAQTAAGTDSDISGALLLAEAALEGHRDGRIIVLSDGALPTLQSDVGDRVGTRPIDWQWLGGPLDNRAVVALAARQRSSEGGTSTYVYARIANFGNTPLATEVRLFGDGQLLDTRNASLPADGIAELTWTLPPGIALLRAEFDGRDTLPIDDSASLNIAPPRPTQVLLISDTPALLERALAAIPGLAVTTIGTSAYTGPAENVSADLTVFDSVVPLEWPIGGSLVINPPASASTVLDVGERRDVADPADSALRIQGALAEGLSLSGIDFGAVRTINPPSWATVHVSRDDQPLVFSGQTGRSAVAVWAFDIEESKLSNRLAFPLLLARSVRELVPTPPPGSILSGEELVFEPSLRADAVEIVAPDGSVQRIEIDEDHHLRFTAELPGVYRIDELAGATPLYTVQLPVNAGAARESALRPQPQPATELVGGPAEDEVITSQRSIWPWLGALALIVLICEWFYVHRGTAGADSQKAAP
jgi:hypothetical protein